MLPDHLLALESLLMLLKSDQLFIFHIFQLVFKIAEFPFFIFHLSRSCL